MTTIETKAQSHEDANTGDPSKVKLPKYLQIVESLRSGIAAGKYRDGSRLPSEAELVRRFGVSRMTVVKAMQQLQQEGLLVRRTGSGTYAAEADKTQNPVFGLMIPDLGETEIFEPICKGMARSPGLSGHSLSWGHSLASSANKEEDVEHLCQQYIEQKVSGVFFAPVEFSGRRDQVNRRILKSLHTARIPVVLLDRCILKYPDRSEYDVVGLDNRRAGYVVADHLIRQGAQHIAFLAKADSAETVDARITGYREALFAHGRMPSKHLLLCGDGSDAPSIEDFLKKNKVDAIQCGNDITAAKLMRSLLGMGVRVPEDIRIAGVDDVKYAGLLPVPLTTFHQPCSDIGAAAIAAMKERIGNPQLPGRSIMLNGHLVVRKSCGAKVEAA
jgi:GntR family transcriptional regulator, arabinose operon transcriptional repressor